MRDLRYRYAYSPRAPRRHAGYLAGLIVAMLGVTVVILAGIIGPVVTHAAAYALVAL